MPWVSSALQGPATPTQVKSKIYDIYWTFHKSLKPKVPIWPFFNFQYFMYRFAEKTAKELEDLRQQLAVLTEKT